MGRKKKVERRPGFNKDGSIDKRYSKRKPLPGRRPTVEECEKAKEFAEGYLEEVIEPIKPKIQNFSDLIKEIDILLGAMTEFNNNMKVIAALIK